MKFKFRYFVIVSLLLQSCATYKHAQKIKMVAMDDDLSKGESLGPIQGEDCTWEVLGYHLGGAPTIDKAFINAKNRADTIESAGFGSVRGKKSKKPKIRYINNVSTDYTGFNAYVFGKTCLTVKGNGYI